MIVYNSIGQKLSEIVNEYKSAGAYAAEFNGNNLSSGIYFYTLESNGNFLTRKMLLVK
ncbi:MAG: T9SS type A sorting domain-containing protein [Ignavibacteria bacterium]|nr:T9SS type A sorting domain-containing protein [Ignavibacteria bacterium]